MVSKVAQKSHGYEKCVLFSLRVDMFFNEFGTATLHRDPQESQDPSEDPSEDPSIDHPKNKYLWPLFYPKLTLKITLKQDSK